VSRMAELDARRRTLLARCEAQRAELAQRVAQLHQRSWPAALAAGAGGGSAQPGRHPLAWIAALAALMLFGRTREVLKLLVWVRVGLSAASRAAQVLRLIRDVRVRRARSASARSTPAR
jgi:hypothetical protein